LLLPRKDLVPTDFRLSLEKVLGRDWKPVVVGVEHPPNSPDCGEHLLYDVLIFGVNLTTLEVLPEEAVRIANAPVEFGWQTSPSANRGRSRR
jgi:hypothetical protein